MAYFLCILLILFTPLFGKRFVINRYDISHSIDRQPPSEVTEPVELSSMGKIIVDSPNQRLYVANQVTPSQYYLSTYDLSRSLSRARPVMQSDVRSGVVQDMVYSPGSQQLFIANRNVGIDVYDAPSLSIDFVTSVPNPVALAVDPLTTTLYALDLSSSMISSYDIPTELMPMGNSLPVANSYTDLSSLAVNSASGRLYASATRRRQILTYDLSSFAGSSPTDVSSAFGREPTTLVLGASLLYVADTAANDIVSFDRSSPLSTQSPATSLRTPLRRPVAIAPALTSGKLYVLNPDLNQIDVYTAIADASPAEVTGNQISDPEVLAIDNSTSTLYVGSLSFTPLTPPSNLQRCIKKDRFLTQTARSASLSWNASPDSRVTAYNIYRDGTLIATVLGLCFEDHCGCSGYAISAIDAQGNESARIN